jgi:hypothetical protein
MRMNNFFDFNYLLCFVYDIYHYLLIYNIGLVNSNNSNMTKLKNILKILLEISILEIEN